MRQVLYISSSAMSAVTNELPHILTTSRRNNVRDGVTGLLWTDGARFLQVLEGAHAAVERTLARIRLDPRHTALVMLHDRTIPELTFGPWAMALMTDGDAHIEAALESASPELRGAFHELITTRRAA